MLLTGALCTLCMPAPFVDVLVWYTEILRSPPQIWEEFPWQVRSQAESGRWDARAERNCEQ